MCTVPPARFVAVRTAPKPVNCESRPFKEPSDAPKLENGPLAAARIRVTKDILWVALESKIAACGGDTATAGITRHAQANYKVSLIAVPLLSPSYQLHPIPNLKMVLLVTSDNEQFTVEKEVAERSVLIKNMLEGG